MSIDFAALTGSVAVGLPEVRACLLVSRDGLPLGSYPPRQESRALAVWSLVAGLGEVERGFAVVGNEVWVFCRRGPYGAVALAVPTARPGLILDRLDEALLVAEQAHQRKDKPAGRNAEPAAPQPDPAPEVVGVALEPLESPEDREAEEAQREEEEVPPAPPQRAPAAAEDFVPMALLRKPLPGALVDEPAANGPMTIPMHGQPYVRRNGNPATEERRAPVPVPATEAGGDPDEHAGASTASPPPGSGELPPPPEPKGIKLEFPPDDPPPPQAPPKVDPMTVAQEFAGLLAQDEDEDR